MNARSFTQAQINSILADYRNGINVNKLAKKYNVAWKTINSVIHRRGTYSRELCSHCGSLKPITS